MKVTENRLGCDGADGLNRPMDGDILVQSAMGPQAIVAGGILAKDSGASERLQTRSRGRYISARHAALAWLLDRAMACGLLPPRRLVLERNASGSVAARANLPGVDAVFAANDAHVIGFMAGLRKVGLLRDGPASERPVAVVGLGDLEMGRLISSSLSTISVHGDANLPHCGYTDARARRRTSNRSRLRTDAPRQRLDECDAVTLDVLGSLRRTELRDCRKDASRHDAECQVFPGISPTIDDQH